ncbi:MAG: 8-oxoguanine deaminase [Acidobacteria bacterium]|nr:8-oxoguanine deaminase [Acidobacteriota bacterium]MBI3656281.1 8-oxoguanine deaminase [Acidobacteriota bacterium]
MGTILIKNALLIATCNDRREKIPHGSIYISDQQITEVSAVDISRPADVVLDGRGKLALPGLINTHHHLYQTLTRNIPEVQNASLFTWLVGLYEIWRELTAEGVFISAQVGMSELLLSGCTTTTDHLYLFPRVGGAQFIDEEIRAARELGMRFQPTRGSMSRGRRDGGLPPDDVVQTESEILQDCRRVVKAYHDPARFSMCRVSLAPCSPFSVTTDLMRQTIEMARREGLHVHTHLAETLDEEAYCLKIYGCRPVEYLNSVGWLGSDVWLAHCVHLNEDEIKLFADTGTAVAHCPTSNMRLGSGIAPVPQMLDHGITVGLGVDGSASNDASNMLAEVRQGLLVHRLQAPVEKWLAAEDLLWLATRGGARALGRDDIGSIEVGKAADIVLIDLEQINYAGALSDPLAAVVFSQSFNHVDTAIVNGKIRVQYGRLVNVDATALIRRANEISQTMIETRYARKP